jgi:hypothetical protein
MGNLGRLGIRLMNESYGIFSNAKVVRQGQILPTENTFNGYYGALDHVLGDMKAATSVWNETFSILISAYPDVDSQSIRDFLDGDGGRRLGDVVIDGFIDNMGAAYDSLDEHPVIAPEAARMKRMLSAEIARQKWISKELERSPMSSTNGSLKSVESVLDRANYVWDVVRSEEKKKNWKERDQAMHDLQKTADVLSTVSRAWMAQRR